MKTQTIQLKKKKKQIEIMKNFIKILFFFFCCFLNFLYKKCVGDKHVYMR